MKRALVAVLVIAVVLPLVAVIAVFVINLKQITSLAYLAFIPAWLFFTFQLTYRYWDKFYFFVERTKLRLTGAGATCSFDAEFKVPDVDRDMVKRIADDLRAPDKSSRLIAQEPMKIVFQMQGMTVAVSGHVAASVTPVPDSATVVVQIVEATWPFRKALQVASESAPALFEQASKAVSATGEKYTVDVRFGSGNPYFGFFVRNLNLAKVDRFIVEMHLEAQGDPKAAFLHANNHHLTITTRKSSILASMSKRYIALSS
ncbi:MAG: hypothetical protein M3082_14620 [Candidatus Dormibacteraeota bacterium]|nr:hypothetical protein [Candidatus Dormibacteraeota bacterium]